MNFFNNEDRGTSNRVHAFVREKVADSMKSVFVADGKAAKLNGFLGSKILGSNLIIAVANRILYPAPGLLTQEVSRFTTRETLRQE